MIQILNTSPSVLNHFLYEMRHKVIQKNKVRFRNNMKRMGMIMAYEISKKLSYENKQVETPLGCKDIEMLSEPPVLVTVMRAGIPLMEGFLEIFTDGESGYFGAFRVEDQGKVPFTRLLYQALPAINNKTVILLDPMLATGRTIENAINEIMKTGNPDKIHIASVVAAPEGVAYLEDTLKISYDLWIGAMDEKLNEHAYIVPGLGDAGDLSFGSKN